MHTQNAYIEYDGSNYTQPQHLSGRNSLRAKAVSSAIIGPTQSTWERNVNQFPHNTVRASGKADANGGSAPSACRLCA